MKSVILFLGIIMISCLVFMTGISYVIFNPLTMAYKKQEQVRTLIPQGWAFFTRNPREKSVLWYQKQNDEWVLINSSSANYKKIFGLSRLSRRQNIELGALMAQLNYAKNWVDCKNNLPNACIPDSTNVLKSKFTNPLIKGEYILRMVEPVPWAWSKLMTESERKSQVLKILVQYDTTKIK
jgi:antimicrobial peptide system SdpA family protein